MDDMIIDSLEGVLFLEEMVESMDDILYEDFDFIDFIL